MTLSEEKFYTLKEVAEMLKVSVAAVRMWVYRGKLPAVKAGTLRRVRESDLVEFLGLNKKERAH